MLYEFSGRNGRKRRGTSRIDQEALADTGKRYGVHPCSKERRSDTAAAATAADDDDDVNDAKTILFTLLR